MSPLTFDTIYAILSLSGEITITPLLAILPQGGDVDER